METTVRELTTLTNLLTPLYNVKLDLSKKLGNLKETIKCSMETYFGKPELTPFARFGLGGAGIIAEHTVLDLCSLILSNEYGLIFKAITIVCVAGMGYVGLDFLASAITGVDMPISHYYTCHIDY